MIYFWRELAQRLVLAGCTSALLCAQGNDLERAATQLASRISTSPGARVAVVDFTDLQGRVTELGRYYSEEFSIALVNASGKLKVIDRGHLKALLVEHKLQSSGLIDEKTAAELGRIAGVTVLVTGSVTELADSVRLTVKALNTKTAAIQAAASISLPKSATTMALLRRDIVDSGPAATAVSAPSSPRPSGAPNVPVFQNDFLIVGVDSLSVRREKDRMYAYLALSLENKSTAEEFIGVEHGYSGHPAYSLVDSRGRDWREDSVSGLPRVASYEFSSRRFYARLSPGARQTAVLKFRVDIAPAEVHEAAVATFALALVRYRGPAEREGNAEPFSVGISGIPLPK